MKHRLLAAGIGLLRYVKLHRLICPFFQGNGIILVMHRVVPEKSQPRILANSRIEITPQFLEELIDFFLRLNYEIVSLDTVYERLTGKGATDRPFVCFTFDDGYVDAFDIIYPIFKKYRLPYAVYVVTDFPDRQSVLWWYMLEDLVLNYDSVKFSYSEREYTFKTISPADKELAYGLIREILLSVSQEKMEEVLEAVFSPYSIFSQNYEDQQMNWNQVMELAHDPQVTIGAHTVHHYNLKQLTTEQVRWEIRTSQERLEEKLERPIRHFAYPYGSSDEAGTREFSLAAESGFRTMTTVREGTIFPDHGKHLSCLPRVEITGRHQDLTLVDLRRCGVISLLRNGLKRIATE